jgi:crotonobetainyl-CoA:carnitine CoA-transferase CaiB-like acyl-CoA transferase
MSDLPNTSVESPAAAAVAAAPVNTAPVSVTPDTASPAASAPAVDTNKVVSSVVQTVQGHPDVAPHKAASIIASILGGLYQAEPAIFALTAASAKTQAEVSLGLGLAEAIVGAFLHPAG